MDLRDLVFDGALEEAAEAMDGAMDGPMIGPEAAGGQDG
jgi:hypothetical protein